MRQLHSEEAPRSSLLDPTEGQLHPAPTSFNPLPKSTATPPGSSSPLWQPHMRQVLVTLSPTLCAAVQANIRRTLRTYKAFSSMTLAGSATEQQAAQGQEEEEEDTALVRCCWCMTASLGLIWIRKMLGAGVFGTEDQAAM